jgi:hypothetical protein
MESPLKGDLLALEAAVRSTTTTTRATSSTTTPAEATTATTRVAAKASTTTAATTKAATATEPTAATATTATLAVWWPGTGKVQAHAATAQLRAVQGSVNCLGVLNRIESHVAKSSALSRLPVDKLVPAD